MAGTSGKIGLAICIHWYRVQYSALEPKECDVGAEELARSCFTSLIVSYGFWCATLLVETRRIRNFAICRQHKSNALGHVAGLDNAVRHCSEAVRQRDLPESAVQVPPVATDL